MEKATSTVSKTSFSCLPTEIIFLIFDYLSSNDIIYIFYFLTQRLNDLLSQSQRYMNYLELPTRKLDAWEIILSIIGSQIKCLNITTINILSKFKIVNYLVIIWFIRREIKIYIRK